MNSIVLLPEEIIFILESYLSHDDYHFFINSSKYYFNDIKRKTIYYQLNQIKSLEYILKEDFHRLVLSKVLNGWKQISLVFPEDPPHLPATVPIHRLTLIKPNKTFPHEVGHIECIYGVSGSCRKDSLEEIPPIPLVKEMSINQANKLQDVRNLSHLTKLSITDAPKLLDVSPISNIPNLTLANCQSLFDFAHFNHCNKQNKQQLTLNNCIIVESLQCFHNIHTLKLISCCGITDVSPLFGIYDLSLINLQEDITDMSGLGNHNRLSIQRCGYKLQGYEILMGIPHVILDECDISDVRVLQLAKSVDLTRCHKLIDVSPLKNVKKVSFLKCASIDNIHTLKDVYDLSFSELNPSGVEWKNHRLEIKFTLYRIFDFSFVKNIQHLIVIQKRELSTLINQGKADFLQSLQSLSIINDSILESTKDLGSIPSLSLVMCMSLKDISDLGRNRSVHLKECPLISDVRSLATVPIVKIEHCRQIEGYHCLPEVQRLKIH